MARAETIVLDANILIRAILGRRVRQLIETYAYHGAASSRPTLGWMMLRNTYHVFRCRRSQHRIFITEQPRLQSSMHFHESSRRFPHRALAEQDHPLQTRFLDKSLEVSESFL